MKQLRSSLTTAAVYSRSISQVSFYHPSTIKHPDNNLILTTPCT